MHLPTINMFGLRIVNAPVSDVLYDLNNRVADLKTSVIAFINAHCANQLDDQEYRRALDRAALILPDGSGMALAARIRGQRVIANCCGTDLVPGLCALLARQRRSVFLFGAERGVGEKAAARLTKICPGLRIAGVQHGYFSTEEEGRIIDQIRTARPDVLLVAMGVPKQELWIDRHLAELPIPLIIGVGALLDFLAGRVRRAPMMLRRLGLEWCYRLYNEPRRLWRRYLIGNFAFTWRAIADATRAERYSDGAHAG